MENNNIRAIFFDFGGVLLQFADGLDHETIEATVGVARGTLFNCLYRESRYMEHQVGGCTSEEWLESVQQAMKRLAGDRAQDLYTAFMTERIARNLNPDMIGLVRRLHGRYTLGIISNTIPGLEERLRREFAHIVDFFDVRIGSGDVGVAKPDEGIFRIALDTARVSPGASVFTDDVAKYAAAARALGMHGFHFTGYAQFAADLRSIGVQA